MKKNLFPLSLLFLLCAAALCGCAEDDEPIAATDGTILTIHATADGFTSTDGADTRATESSYTTTFTADDEIGVFAVKDGAVIAGCKNVKCTYDAGNNTWNASTPVYYYTGAQYFAYYPYKDNLSSADITSVDGIVNYFNENVATDQGTYADYTAWDLMTAESVSPSGGNKSLSFSFTHKMSLIEISLPIQKYKTPTAYEYSSPIIGATFSIVPTGSSTSTITPYNISKGIYRYIIPAGTSYTVSGEFSTIGNKTITYTQSVSLSAGNYKRLNVTYSGATTITERALAIGDFYYSDGSIFPGNMGNSPNPPTDGCIGVIYCVDKSFITGNSTNTNSYTHGLVVALKDASSYSLWVNAGSAVSWYQNTVAAPSSSSGWYLPNIEELKYICRGSNYGTQSTTGKTALHSQFTRLGGSADNFTSKEYWSSTVYQENWYSLYVNFSNGEEKYHWQKLENFRVRCVLAF